ncbi:prepilin peptidase [Dermatobacter hominis]|uniref:prepilin peptidase n=1 Tax=Dermatobacter hominis TaxID=2884263 RepID=UPI001D11A18C|nr:A24 family peptidase [Dermatobacter hominis]UDY37959.1 prepilin peptidase [Dermatobacter hominis]
MTGTQIVLLVFGTVTAFAVGSFLCVVIDRLPLALNEPNEYGDLYDTRPWNEVLGGHSRCDECGEPIRAIDKIPVLSWILLRGRCRGCSERIPAFHPVVELLTPALFLAAVWAIGWDWRLLPVLGLIPAGIAVSVIDIRTMIVPTRVVWPAFGAVVALSVVTAAIEGEWSWLLAAATGLAALAGPLFVLWFFLPSGMGFGDVRLAVLLGWTIGFYAGTRPVAAVLLAVITLFFAAVIGLVMGIAVMGARGRKAKVPFGPALVMAAFLSIALAEPILDSFGVWALS